MLHGINNLREIVHCFSSGRQLDEGLSRWLASALEDFLDHRCNDLHEAFGLKAGQGGVPWWLEVAIRERNTALQDLADALRPERSISALVRRVHVLTVRYAASAWCIDRNYDDMPQHYAGTAKEYLWRAFKSGAPMPLGERQLRNIVGY